MTEFFNDLVRFPFLQNALIISFLASIACGITGTYVVVRRIAAIAGTIAHCTLGGIGAALYFKREHGMEFLTPFSGALAAALIGAVIIGLVTMYAGEREDTVLAAVWAVGMAAGIFFISKTRG
ncbi:MAG: metal ABC transporter permease, partial [bacterium]